MKYKISVYCDIVNENLAISHTKLQYSITARTKENAKTQIIKKLPINVTNMSIILECDNEMRKI